MQRNKRNGGERRTKWGRKEGGGRRGGGEEEEEGRSGTVAAEQERESRRRERGGRRWHVVRVSRNPTPCQLHSAGHMLAHQQCGLELHWAPEPDWNAEIRGGKEKGGGDGKSGKGWGTKWLAREAFRVQLGLKGTLRMHATRL